MDAKQWQKIKEILKLRRNKLGLRFLYRLRSNTVYTKSLNTLDDKDNQNYKENEEVTKPTVWEYT